MIQLNSSPHAPLRRSAAAGKTPTCSPRPNLAVTGNRPRFGGQLPAEHGRAPPARKPAAHAPERDPGPAGAWGVRIHTSFSLAREILDWAGSPLTLISDPIQVRFLRSLVDKANLRYYAPLTRKPGFIRALRTLITELTQARITPSNFGRAVRSMGEPPRLAELARIYAMYQKGLQAQNWVDRANLLIAAQNAIQDRPQLLQNWRFWASMVNRLTRLNWPVESSCANQSPYLNGSQKP